MLRTITLAVPPLLLLPAFVGAQPEPKHPAADRQEQRSGHGTTQHGDQAADVNALIKRVDRTAHTITVTTESGEQREFKVTDQTRLYPLSSTRSPRGSGREAEERQNLEPGAWMSRLREGTHVVLSFEQQGGENFVRVLRISARRSFAPDTHLEEKKDRDTKRETGREDKEPPRMRSAARKTST